MSEHDTPNGDQDSSTDEQVVPATVTSDGERVVVVTPDGMGVAVRALCSALDYAGIDYSLRTFKDIRTLRGF